MNRYTQQGQFYVPDAAGQWTLACTQLLSMGSLAPEGSKEWQLNEALHAQSRFPMPVVELDGQRFTLVDCAATHSARVRELVAAAGYDGIQTPLGVYPLHAEQLAEYVATDEDKRQLVEAALAELP